MLILIDQFSVTQWDVSPGTSSSLWIRFRFRYQRTNEMEVHGPARETLKSFIAREDQESGGVSLHVARRYKLPRQQNAMHEGSCDNRRRPDDLNILFLCRKKEKRRVNGVNGECSRCAVRSTR